MPTINNASDWWQVLHEHWDGILAHVGNQMQMDHPAYDVPGDATSAPTGRTINDELYYLRSMQDKERLPRYLAATWGLASEAYAREGHSDRAWNALCDLLSEEWALHPELLKEE